MQIPQKKPTLIQIDICIAGETDRRSPVRPPYGLTEIKV
jgi:hypothetical protein